MSAIWEPDVSRIDSDLDHIVVFISNLTQEEESLLSQEEESLLHMGPHSTFNGHSFLHLHHAINDITIEYICNCELYTSQGAKPSYYIHLYDLLLKGWWIIKRICDIRDFEANDMISQNIEVYHWRTVMANCANVEERMDRLMSAICFLTRRYRNMDGYDMNDQTHDLSFPDP